MKHLEYRMTRSALPLGVALLAFCLFAVGCDTVAEISFQSRNFANLHSSGFISAPGMNGAQCGTLGTDRQAKTNLRFVMLDDSGPSRPYTPDNTATIMSGDDVDVSLSNGQIYEPEDVACTENSDCDLYQCLPADDAQLRRCGNETNFEVGPVRFLSNRQDDNVIGLAVEHGATVRGSFPANMRGFYDRNEDGQGEVSFSSIEPQRASDDSDDRITALNRFVSTWADVADNASSRDVNTHLGLWGLNNQGTFDSAIASAGCQQPEDDDAVWCRDQSDNNLSNFVRQFGNRNIEETDNLVRPFVAINDLIEGPFSQFDNADKTLVVIVDGPPEIPFSATGNLTLPDDAIQAAVENNVRVHIVHFDSSVDPDKYPDSVSYWNEQSGNCSSDADCRDWETCREVRGFSETDGGQVSPQPSGTYCMPERRETDGRVGPISAYGRIACATEGSYQYIKSPEAVSEIINWLPYETDGLWEAELEVLRVNDGDVEPNGPSRLGAGMTVTLPDDSSRTVDFSQNGISELPAGTADNRSTLFIGDVGN